MIYREEMEQTQRTREILEITPIMLYRYLHRETQDREPFNQDKAGLRITWKCMSILG